MGKRIDITGQKFGRLTVIEYSHTDKHGQSYWKCKCDCGNIKVIRGTFFKRGVTQSCGCLRKEISTEVHTTHGMRGHPLYDTWVSMIQRCYNPKRKCYKNYGGRGIKICDGWKNDPHAFCNWAEENGWEKGLTLDRIDNDGNYEPENCRWIINKEQQSNKRNNVFLTVNGKTQTTAQWADELGIRSNKIRWRKKQGWSDYECVYGRKHGEEK